MAGIFCERSGVFNIAIEGMMLIGRLYRAWALPASFDSLWMGVLAASLTGGLMAALHAVLSIKYKVDQIISGTVINILAAGATRFLNIRLLEPAGLSTPGHFEPIAIPVLSKIPVLGPILFNNQPTVYIMLILLVVVNYVIFATPWGLRMRACGEHPRAADTVGVHVNRMRYISVIIGGLIAGIGGAYFSLGQVGTFEDNMTGGQGFVALAAMIFGQLEPDRRLYGGAAVWLCRRPAGQDADPRSRCCPFINVPIPPEFLQTTPYILTIIVLAGVVGSGHRAGGGRQAVREAIADASDLGRRPAGLPAGCDCMWTSELAASRLLRCAPTWSGTMAGPRRRACRPGSGWRRRWPTASRTGCPLTSGPCPRSGQQAAAGAGRRRRGGAAPAGHRLPHGDDPLRGPQGPRAARRHLHLTPGAPTAGT